MESKSKYITSFKDLEVYKIARQVAKDIFIITNNFPKEEKYSLTDQIRRSSRSIGAQISEAWGKRRYVNHFISKLTDSDAEQLETQHWLEISHECDYLSDDEMHELIKKCESIGKMLNKMISKSNLFCKKTDY
ncbi:four helix bundle protein [Bacteroidota bacterium]